MEKKLVCQADGRRFKSKAALAQHRADAHGSAPKASTSQRNQSVRRQETAAAQGAVVSTVSTVRSSASDSARMSGIDRIFHGSVELNLREGVTAVSTLIGPSVFKRLALVARAYQRIRYLRLRFRMEPQMSTSTSGGYVIAFIRDPADIVGDISSLTAQQGSVTTKWWQSSVVNVAPPNRLFYTSESVEVREYSPGRLVLMVDGPATQVGSYTIFAEWTVELSSPALEQVRQVEPSYTVAYNWFTRVGEAGLWMKVGVSSWVCEAQKLLPGCRTGGSYKLPFPITIPSSASNGRIAHWVYVKDANRINPCYSGIVDQDDALQSVENLFLTQGTILKDDSPPPPQVSGEERAPSSSDCPTTTAGLGQLLELCSQLLMRASESQTASSRRSMDCSQSSLVFLEPSDCMGNSSSMESPPE